MVSDKTIENCFKHGGFSLKTDEAIDLLHDVLVPTKMIVETFEEIVDQDVESPVVGELTDAEILEVAQQSKRDRLEEDVNESDEELENEAPLPELLSSLTNLRKFSQKSGLSSVVLSSLHKIETQIAQERMNRASQTNITQFFKQL